MSIDKKKLAGLSMTRIGNQANRLMNQSTKLTNFLKGEFKVPSSIKESAKWVEKQIYGCANVRDIEVLVNEAIKRSVKGELDSVTKVYTEMDLTEEQAKLLPGAIKEYENYLNDYFGALKILKNTLQILKKQETKSVKVEKVVTEAEQVKG